MATLDTINELRDQVSDLASYEALYTAQKEYVRDTLTTKDADLTKRQQDAKELKATLEAKIEAAKKRKAAAAANNNKKNGAAADGAIAKKHVEACAALYDDLYQRKVAFKYIADIIAASPDASNGGASNLKYADLGKAAEYKEGWATFEGSLDKRIAELTSAQKRLGAAIDVNPIEALTQLAEDVREAHATVSGALIRELSRRNNYTTNVQQLRESQSQLMLWCRQQRSTMENLKESGQIQEYTNSFQSNITVMETNFLVLMELAEPLLPNPEVSKLLEEVIEVWLSLQVYSFEKLNATIMEQHEASTIEADLTRWLEHEGNVVSFLNKARDVLSMPVDDESREVTAPVLEQCDKLLSDVESFNIIASHLSTFTLREANLTEYYQAIRRTIFSKLTISTQVYNGQYSFEKKQQYMDRLAELNDWVDCKSQNAVWKQLLQRVDNMKTLIEENKATHGTAEERGY